MSSSSQPVQVATGAPLLRVVLVLLLLITALAGVLVTGGVHAGWLALGFVLVAGPVAVMVDGRARARSAAASAPRARPERPQAPEQDRNAPRRAA